MLVLSRHRDETIMIGDDTELTIIDIRGDKVRIGIKAPPHVPVPCPSSLTSAVERASTSCTSSLGCSIACWPIRTLSR